jgi:hypothetical protein
LDQEPWGVLLELEVPSSLAALEGVVSRRDGVEVGDRSGHIRPAGKEQFLQGGGKRGGVALLAVHHLHQRILGVGKFLVAPSRLLRASLEGFHRRFRLLHDGGLLRELIGQQLHLPIQHLDLLLLEFRQLLLPLRHLVSLTPGYVGRGGPPLELVLQTLDLLLLRFDRLPLLRHVLGVLLFEGLDLSGVAFHRLPDGREQFRFFGLRLLRTCRRPASTRLLNCSGILGRSRRR